MAKGILKYVSKTIVKNGTEHIEQLTADIMIRYQNGDLSDRQMHQVERLLLESDFEADAMEGFDSVSANVVKQDLDTLQDRLGKRIEKERKISFPVWWAAAASVVILLTAGLFFLNSPDRSAPIAMEESIPEDPDNSFGNDSERSMNDEAGQSENREKEEMSESTAENSEDVTGLISEADETKAKDPSNRSVAKNEISSTSEEKEKINEEVTENVDVIPDSELAVITTVPRVDSDTTPAGALTQADIRKTEQELVGVIKGEEFEFTSPMPGKKFGLVHGRVIDQAGDPVAGANVKIPRTRASVVSNLEGEFDLDIGDIQADQTVISIIGLKSNPLPFPESDSLTVILEEDEADLGEIVITGGNNPENNVIYRGAGPVGGLEVFENYLANNLKQIQKEGSVGRDVLVIFTVFTNGRLGEFRVRKSPDENVTREAIRLIREGPQWLPALKDGSAVTDRVRVRITFE